VIPTTKKDYKAIAEALRKSRTVDGGIDGYLAMQYLEQIFIADNPRFNKDKFRAAIFRD
jgi:hypothetical protein